MKKIFALFTTILLLSPCTITAQTEDNEYSFDENAYHKRYTENESCDPCGMNEG